LKNLGDTAAKLNKLLKIQSKSVTTQRSLKKISDKQKKRSTSPLFQRAQSCGWGVHTYFCAKIKDTACFTRLVTAKKKFYGAMDFNARVTLPTPMHDLGFGTNPASPSPPTSHIFVANHSTILQPTRNSDLSVPNSLAASKSRDFPQAGSANFSF
jgi:hypothetical protein